MIEASSLVDNSFDHPHLVVCGVRNEEKLMKAMMHLESQGVVCRPFREPDLENSLTSFATEPIQQDRRHLFRRFNCLTASDLSRDFDNKFAFSQKGAEK